MILAAPKPSFYPAYVEQLHNETGYRDYGMPGAADKHTTLAGHKRYFAKVPENAKLASNAKDNKNVNTQLELAPINSTFEGKIVFHNLKQEELAALIWCLCLPESKHQLGHGKPLRWHVSIQPRITHLFANDIHQPMTQMKVRMMLLNG